MTSTGRSSRVRIGVIGTSPFTQSFHLESLKGHPAVQVTALCGRDRKRAEAAAEKYGIPGVVTDYRELVSSPQVDAVIIVTPNVLHYPMTLAAVAAKKHVFCEKPLGMNLAEAREMYEKAEAAHVVHMTNFTNRGLPAAIQMKEGLSQGYVGKVYHISINVVTSFHRENVMTWRRDRRQAGTGALGDIGSHMLDLARWFGGDVKRVAAHLATVAKELRVPETGKPVANETDDACAMLLDYQSGAQGVVHLTWVAHPSLGARLRVEVHGSEGVLLFERRRGVNDPKSLLTLYGARGEKAKLEPLAAPAELTDGLDLSSEEALIRTLNAKPWYAARRFVEAVLGRREMSPSLYDGMKVQAIIDSAVQSHQQGRWVDVP